MKNRFKLLFVEDSQNDVDLLLRHLQKEGVEVEFERVDTEEALSKSLEKDWDAIISDYNLPLFNALKTISIAKSIKPEIPLIVMSGAIGEAVAVETIKAGASDYVMKSNVLRVIPALERAIKERVFRVENRQIEETLKKKEEELRQAQKLEAIGQLAGGIAHDFNNILAAILMEVDFLTEEVRSGLSSEMLVEHTLSGLARINDAAGRATNLTRQLLAFSRKQVIQPKVLNVTSLIRNLESMLRPIVEENIEFKLTLSNELGNIKVDPGHFEQIIMNLVINSRDAMPHGGLLEISTCNSSLEEFVAKRCNVATDPYMLLTVKDSGTGISPEVQKRLFEPFFTTKPLGKGTGLGLCTIYGIVKQNRGLIFVESELGKGTTFKVYFPRVDEEVEKTQSLPVVRTQLRGNETLLFVEDEVNLRDVARKILEKNGYKVLTASNGIEALNTLRSHPDRIHLIVTDVVMPQMGGSELASKVHEFDKDVKILFQSGYTEDTLIQNGIRTGLIHFLEKPYNIKSLLATVRRILS